MQTVSETIEKSIDIDADAATVWAIVSVPGWWINKGTIRDHRIEDLGSGMSLVHDPDHGEFRIETVRVEEPHFAAFRWHPTDPADPSTLVELSIRERSGGVTLEVVESDFAGLPPERLPQFVAGNTEGWETELGAAKAAAER